MRVFKNEKGSALIIVLLITTLFTILGLALLSMNISNTKQVIHREADLQATNLAEMGIKHLITDIEVAIDQSLPDLNKYIDKLFDDGNYTEGKEFDKFFNLLNSNFDDSDIQITVTGSNTLYSYLVHNIDINKQSSDTIEISFVSTGIVEGKEEKSLYTTFNILKKNVSIDNGDGAGNNNQENNYCTQEADNKKTTKINKNCITTGSVIYENQVDIVGSHTLKVDGDATFKDDLNLNGNPAKLCVKGNLTVEDGVISSAGNNSAKIFVYSHDANIVLESSGNNDIEIITVDSLTELEQECGSFSGNNSSPQYLQWTIDHDSTNIEYSYSPS